MANVLNGKIALITGGTAGLGLAIAKRFVAEGAFVFITGRRVEQLEAAVSDIGQDAVSIRADVSSQSDLAEAVALIKERKGRLDIVVANAGIIESEPLGSITGGAIDRILAANVKGVILTVQNALPLLCDGASVILLSSMAGAKGMAGNSVYAASKAAVRNLAQSWIEELRERRIRVNAISPGVVDTPGFRGIFRDTASVQTVLSSVAASIALGRVGTPDDIAKVAVFLATDASGYINGAEIQVDGGRTRG